MENQDTLGGAKWPKANQNDYFSETDCPTDLKPSCKFKFLCCLRHGILFSTFLHNKWCVIFDIFGMPLCNFIISRHVRMHDSVTHHSKAITALSSPCILWNINDFTSIFEENFKTFFPSSRKSSSTKYNLNFSHWEKYHKVFSMLWKLLSAFIPPNSFNYLTVEVLLAYFPLSTMFMKL